MKRILLVLVALALLAGGWFYASPLMALSNMKSAAQAKDAERLSKYVDYEALRSDLKADFRRMMAAEAAKQPANPFGAIGMALATAFIDPMVDAMVSPEGVEAMFRQQQATAAKQGKPTLAAAAPGDDPVIERVSLDEFRVRGKEAGKGSMIFRRHGLGWKLSGVDIPAE